MRMSDSTITNRPELTSYEASGQFKPASNLLLALIIASSIAVFCLITLGGIVRITGSGLGCPDWPLCHGKLIPPFEFHTLIEYTHRLVASSTGVIVLATAVTAVWNQRRLNSLVALLSVTVFLVGVAGALGGATVLTELHPNLRTLHLATAQTIFALLMVSLVWGYRSRTAPGQGDEKLFSWASAAAIATFVVILSGSYIVGRGAGTVCPGWPLCDSGLMPNVPLGWLHLLHRLLAGAGAVLAGIVVLLAWRHRQGRRVFWMTAVAVGALVAAQTLAGAANPWTGFSAAARAVHLSLATALLGGLVALATMAKATSLDLGRAKDYITLAKPKIVVLLLITALGGMFLAAQGVPPLGTALLVLFAGSLGAGGANAINHYLDRDIDARMNRTSRRPLPGHRIPAKHALWLGIGLNVAAFGVLALWVNLLSALLVLGATLFYAIVYTAWLKRTWTQNIVIGGAAGAVPPVVGWAAITGGLDLPALYLFAIIFFWTPPHFWALSLLLKNDYAKAGIPMLPVVAGEHTTAKAILMHSLILVAISLAFVTAQAVDWVYALSAAMLGATLLFYVVRLLRDQTKRAARQLYLYSLLYLTLLFAAVMVDSSVSL